MCVMEKLLRSDFGGILLFFIYFLILFRWAMVTPPVLEIFTKGISKRCETKNDLNFGPCDVV
jgi:hypothetical protein